MFGNNPGQNSQHDRKMSKEEEKEFALVHEIQVSFIYDEAMPWAVLIRSTLTSTDIYLFLFRVQQKTLTWRVCRVHALDTLDIVSYFLYLCACIVR